MNPILKAIIERGSRATTKPDKAKAIGFDPERKFYHGTNAPDIQEFDLDKVDVGVHIAPDYETATNRLLDTRTGERANTRTFPNQFESGANIIPLHARMNKTLQLPDLGAWDDPDRVATGIADYFQWADVEKGQGISKKAMEELDALTEYPFENKRQYFDKIREILNREGYDSIRYQNTFEGMGGRAVSEATAKLHAMQSEIDAMRSLAFDRRKNWISDQVANGGDRYQLERNTSVESFLNPEEVAMTKSLQDDMKVYFQPHMDDPNMQVASEAVQYDPFSYIIMNPADLRATTAKFDPKMSKSASLTAGQAALGAGGILGALGLPEDATAADIATAGMKIAPKEEAQGEFQQMILDALLGFMAPTQMGDATMDAYNRNRVR